MKPTILGLSAQGFLIRSLHDSGFAATIIPFEAHLRFEAIGFLKTPFPKHPTSLEKQKQHKSQAANPKTHKLTNRLRTTRDEGIKHITTLSRNV